MNRRQVLALLAARGRPWAGGSFLQFWAEHLGWDGERWERLFGYLAALRARELVVQWSGYDGIDYGGLTERVLKLASARGMRVRVGLRHESRWWKDVEAGPAVALAALERRTAQLDRTLLRAIARWEAFAGWYVPEEIDDGHWGKPEAARELAEALRGVRSRVGRLAVSGFTNGALGPGALGEFWRGVTRRSGVEEVLFQDGIGAGKTTLQSWPGYAEALGRRLGGRLRVVVETFEARGGGGEFRAGPAGVGRVLEQCRVAARYSRKPPLAFSLPEYCTPLGGAEAGARYGEYLAAIDHF